MPSKKTKHQRKETLSQTSVPSYSLQDALRVITAINENYAGRPSRPIEIAAAMEITPTSSVFRMLCGASMAYGLTDASYNSAQISITDLGKRITRPLAEGDDLLAKKEAALKPKVLREFFQKYNGGKLPKEQIVKNVLSSLDVPQGHLDKTYKLVVETGKYVGFFREIKGEFFVDINGTPLDQDAIPADTLTENEAQPESFSAIGTPIMPTKDLSVSSPTTSTPKIPTTNLHNPFGSATNNRVFITHGKNTSLVPQIGELLKYGNLEPVVSIHNESVSKPVPEKVMDDMRSCGAAIIHVEAESLLPRDDGSKETIINPNVLIEIGAAMALYGKRFILLVRDGVKLPSNLQGLYEVRYEGEKLDGETTIRLLKAFNAMKNTEVLSSTKSPAPIIQGFA